MNCNNCNHKVNTAFCSNCGHPAKLKRIDGHYIIHEIQHVLHLERGMLYTIKELIIHPGQCVRNYLAMNRSRLVKPIIFIILTSLIYSLCNYFFHFEDGYVAYANSEASATNAMFKWVQSHYGYANIMMAVFIAMCIKLFFRKSAYNFFEILILLCFVMGIGMLIFSVFGIVQGLTHINLMQFGGLAGILYATWAIGQFYGKEKFVHYVKAFFAYMLGLLFFSLTIVLVGLIVDTVF